MLSQASCTFPSGSQEQGEEHRDLEKQKIRTSLGSVYEGEQIEGGPQGVGEAVIQTARMAGDRVLKGGEKDLRALQYSLLSGSKWSPDTRVLALASV